MPYQSWYTDIIIKHIITWDFILIKKAYVNPIAYPCLGYVDKFEDRPDLERVGYLKRTILSKVIHFGDWNNTELNNNHN